MKRIIYFQQKRFDSLKYTILKVESYFNKFTTTPFEHNKRITRRNRDFMAALYSSLDIFLYTLVLKG